MEQCFTKPKLTSNFICILRKEDIEIAGKTEKLEIA